MCVCLQEQTEAEGRGRWVNAFTSLGRVRVTSREDHGVVPRAGGVVGTAEEHNMVERHRAGTQAAQ